MSHQRLHHNKHLLGIWTVILVVTTWVAGGVSAMTVGTLPCKAECCCAADMTTKTVKHQIIYQKANGRCCHASNGTGLFITDCKSPIIPRSKSINISAISADHTLYSLNAIAYEQGETISNPQKCFGGSSYLLPKVDPIPIYLQKTSFLC